MCKISVIIPVYNGETYLAQCLDSIIGQTLKEIEIICVNDGTKDRTQQILEKYAEKDSRIQIINQENGGAGAENIYPFWMEMISLNRICWKKHIKKQKKVGQSFWCLDQINTTKQPASTKVWHGRSGGMHFLHTAR